jgi:hypothetical protein
MKVGTQLLIVLASIMISGCASNHHLVFFTNTTLGVEVGSEPTSGSAVKFIVGYKRQEGVIDPLIPDYKFIPNSPPPVGVEIAGQKALTEPVNGDTNVIMTPQGTAVPTGKNNAHSVIAKMNFGATGGGGTETTGAQFFATGKAAEILAKSEGITAALAGDSKIVTKQKVNLGSGGIIEAAALASVFQLLDNHSTGNSSTAGEALNIKLKLNALDSGIFKTAFTQYSDQLLPNIDIKTYPVQPGVTDFPNVISYLVKLKSSLEVAKSVVLDSNAKNKGMALTAQERQDMVSNISTYPSKIEGAQKSLSENSDMVAAINFVTNKILLIATNN